MRKAAKPGRPYVPDLPGCVSGGETPVEYEVMIREAIKLHLEGLRAEGLPVPEPSSEAGTIEISAAERPQGTLDQPFQAPDAHQRLHPTASYAGAQDQRSSRSLPGPRLAQGHSFSYNMGVIL